MSNGSSWQDSTGPTTGMRRRQGVGTAQNSDEAIANGQDSGFVRTTVSKFDMYAKVDDDLQVKTETGAAVTIGFWMLMVVLVIGEIQAYLQEKPAIERVVVDNTMGQRLRINANIVSQLDHLHKEVYKRIPGTRMLFSTVLLLAGDHGFLAVLGCRPLGCCVAFIDACAS